MKKKKKITQLLNKFLVKLDLLAYIWAEIQLNTTHIIVHMVHVYYIVYVIVIEVFNVTLMTFTHFR